MENSNACIFSSYLVLTYFTASHETGTEIDHRPAPPEREREMRVWVSESCLFHSIVGPGLLTDMRHSSRSPATVLISLEPGNGGEGGG